ncbi:CoA transferase [Synergistales bacterium]|nr:CoA transferase [Synergistales bacterium]
MARVSKGVLDGVKVLDLTRVLAGPYCGMMLADMGAEVIKLESPGKGDDSRAFYPQIKGESAYYMNLNRNKRGITLNLKSAKGKEIFIKLVKKVDIIIENFRPGTMEKLGLGYEALKKENPAIVYGCVSGFGQYGPYSKQAGYDIIGQAAGGLMSTTGWPGGEPTRSGTAMSDVLGGLNVCIGVLASYIKAKQTGQGQLVDISLVDAVVSSLEIITQIYLASGKIPERIGNRYESVYPYDSFKAKDGSLVIACGNNKLFTLFANLMDMPELIEDPLYKNNIDRVTNHAQLKPIVEKWLADKTIDEAVKMILDVGVPASPINTIDRVVSDPHIAVAREMFVEVEHPVAGKLKLTGNQIKFSEDKIEIRTPAPTLGQHTGDVLRDYLGYTAEQTEQLRQENVI